MVYTTGCAAFRASTHEVNVEDDIHFTENFDHSDMRSITEGVVDELAGSSFITEHEKPPLFMIAGVQNRTSQYVDTKSLTDRMRTLLFKANVAQFVNESRRADLLEEQGYQAAHATPESQTAVGRQLGAKYMISGSLTEMTQTSPKQVRVSKQKLNYYKLTFEVTDLETSLLVWTTEKEFARQASKPLIGW
jgi:PBP1b-binding outer membrane lipoprotein LpoB